MSKKTGSRFDTRWGLAAKVSVDVLEELAKRLLGDERWLVIPGDDGVAALVVGDGEADDELAAAFVAQHRSKVYFLDFDDEVDDGEAIVEFDKGKRKRKHGHPAAFLEQHGIIAPGYEPPTPSSIRSVIVLEGTHPAMAKKLGFDAFTHSEHPRGTLITGPSSGEFAGKVSGSEDYAKKFGGPVYALSYDTLDGRFWCVVEQRGKRSRRFDPHSSQKSEHYENVDSILGETTLEGISRVLEIPLEMTPPAGFAPRLPNAVQTVIVLDGVRPAVAKGLGYEALTLAEHPRGTLITGADSTSAFGQDYVDKLDGVAYEVSFNAKDGSYWCIVEQRDKAPRRFDPRPRTTPAKYRAVDDILGEVTLEGICRVLEIPIGLLRGSND